MSDQMLMIDLPRMRAAVRDEAAFGALVDEWGLDEVRLSLVALSDLIRVELPRRRRFPGERRELLDLQRVVETRVHVVKMEIRDRNRAESATVEAIERKWSAFAEHVAEALYLLDPAALRAIAGPGDAEISAEEWLHLRKQRAARKAARLG